VTREEEERQRLRRKLAREARTDKRRRWAAACVNVGLTVALACVAVLLLIFGLIMLGVYPPLWVLEWLTAAGWIGAAVAVLGLLVRFRA
jgi:hypothetical protein